MDVESLTIPTPGVNASGLTGSEGEVNDSANPLHLKPSEPAYNEELIKTQNLETVAVGRTCLTDLWDTVLVIDGPSGT